MKKCAECGFNAPDDAEFCSKCGARLAKRNVRKYLAAPIAYLALLFVALVVVAVILSSQGQRYSILEYVVTDALLCAGGVVMLLGAIKNRESFFLLGLVLSVFGAMFYLVYFAVSYFAVYFAYSGSLSSGSSWIVLVFGLLSFFLVLGLMPLLIALLLGALGKKENNGFVFVSSIVALAMFLVYLVFAIVFAVLQSALILATQMPSLALLVILIVCLIYAIENRKYPLAAAASEEPVSDLEVISKNLKELKGLLDQGIISQDEYETAKLKYASKL